MKTLAACILAASLFMSNRAAAQADPTADEAAIRQVVQERQSAAWDRHDAEAYANLFASDGDVVNVFGWWKGRAEIQSKLTAAFAHAFNASTLTITDVQVRFLASDVAIAHARWTMVGAKMPPSLPEPRQGIQTITLAKHSGSWLIAAFQNTIGLPEAHF